MRNRVKLNIENINISIEFYTYSASLGTIEYIKIICEHGERNLMLDGRDNTIHEVIPSNDRYGKMDKVIIYIIESYYELKKTDFKYGTENIKGSKKIKLQIFLQFLISKSRDNVITSILN